MVRLADVCISIVALLLLSPLLLPICILLKFTGEGEIFFMQERIGVSKKKFKLVKFATMLKNSPNMGSGTLTLANDPRVLPLGKILRTSKINELPQLYNVLVGVMSLVGPRPQAEKNFLMYSPNDQWIISTIKPGLTGIGSLVFSDEEKILQSVTDPEEFYRLHIMQYKASLEAWYVANKNLMLYAQILMITFLRVVLRAKLKPHSFFVLPEPSQELKNVLHRI